MESMQTRKDIKLFIEDALETKITRLTWSDCDVFMFLLSMLSPKHFGILAKIIKFILQPFDLILVIFQTAT